MSELPPVGVGSFSDQAEAENWLAEQREAEQPPVDSATIYDHLVQAFASMPDTLKGCTHRGRLRWVDRYKWPCPRCQADAAMAIVGRAIECERSERHAAARGAAIERVRDMHRAHRIYDECDHRHEYTDPDHGLPDGVVEIAEIGLTCEDGYLYSICRECCADADELFQTEECVDTHGHKPDEAHHCRTVAALDGTEATDG